MGLWNTHFWVSWRLLIEGCIAKLACNHTISVVSRCVTLSVLRFWDLDLPLLPMIWELAGEGMLLWFLALLTGDRWHVTCEIWHKTCHCEKLCSSAGSISLSEHYFMLSHSLAQSYHSEYFPPSSHFRPFLAISRLFKAIHSNSRQFQTIPGYSILFQSISMYISLFEPISI